MITRKLPPFQEYALIIAEQLLDQRFGEGGYEAEDLEQVTQDVERAVEHVVLGFMAGFLSAPEE